jgi:hypothetical protein
MHIQIYDDKIIAPNKHGTRFLNQVFDFKYVDSDQAEIFKQKKWLNKNVWFIYRDPMEHLVSALHTEIIVFLEQSNTIDDYDKIIEKVINTFIQPKDTTHWCKDLLKGLHNMWCISNKEKFKIIELKNLSPLLLELGYNIPEFNYEDYQFANSKFPISKETIQNIVKNKFPDKWNCLMSMIKSENESYYKLNNKIIKFI